LIDGTFELALDPSN
jgi:hypothetical protein